MPNVGTPFHSDPQAHSVPSLARAERKHTPHSKRNLQSTPAHLWKEEWEQAANTVFPAVRHGHTIARNRKEKIAPSARPRDRKKAMMAPAVSASAGFTFLGPKHMQRLAR